MICLDSISKQIGHQIPFIEAPAALRKGEKVGQSEAWRKHVEVTRGELRRTNCGDG
jgi:hypothetical protein